MEDFPNIPNKTHSECSCCKVVKKDIDDKKNNINIILKIEEVKYLFYDNMISNEDLKISLNNLIELSIDPTIFLEDSIISERINIFYYLIDEGATVYGTNKLSILIAQCKNKENMINMFTIIFVEGSTIDYKALEILAYKGYIDILKHISSLFFTNNYIFRRWLSVAKNSLIDYDTKDKETQLNCKSCFLFCIDEAFNTWKLYPSMFEEYGTAESLNSYSIGFVKTILKYKELNQIFTTEELNGINTFISHYLS